MLSTEVFCSCLVLLILQSSYFTSSLASECIQENSEGEDYTGHVNETITGQPCVSWVSVSRCNQILPDKNLTLAENFCRNPEPDACHQDIRHSPWCYTNSEDQQQWEYCDVPRCDDPDSSCSMALGMGSGSIANSQITASSVYSEANAPYKARINYSNTDYWIPFYSGSKNYLKVDLLRPHTVKELYVQGSLYYYVKTFNVLYSMDDLVWMGYSDTHGGEMKTFVFNAGTLVVAFPFNNPFTAVQIAIVPRTWESLPGLRIEIFGCPVNATVPRATEVTQSTLQTNSQWSVENSPYVVREEITVNAGATLTIQAGVRVVFIGQEAGLTVFGCLQLNGITGIEVYMGSNNPLSVVFSSDSDVNFYWQGVTISPVSTACSANEIDNLVLSGAKTGLSLTTRGFNLVNVVIKNCQTAILLAKSNTISNASFVKCLFHGNQVAIQIKLSGRALVTSSVFTNNQYGIKFSLDYAPEPGNSNSLDIRGSEFLQNTYALYTGTGDVYNGHSLLLRIYDSFFQASVSQLIRGQTGYYYWLFCGADITTEIEQCSFDDSSIMASSCSKYTVSINNSSFFNSVVYYPISIEGNCNSLLILNSSIADNKVDGLYLRAYATGEFRIERNLFSRNTGSTCISLNLQTGLATGNVSIVGNSFLNNSVANVIYINDLSPERLNATVLENRFENPASTFELYINTHWKSDYFLDAKQNWWGGNDERFIESRIYDFYSDFRLGTVDMDSVYLDSSMTNLVDSSTWRDFDANSSNFGGVVRQNTTIDLESKNVSIINVNNSIHVPSNVQLQLNGSSIVIFAKLTGIVVEGWQ